MRTTYAQIDLAAIRHNMRQIRATVSPSTFIMAVVKANAYGHGAVKISAAALSAGANGLGVAIPEEGAELRESGFKVPIFVVGLTLPEQVQLFLDYDLVATISTLEMARALAEAARRVRRKAQVLVKIDTGMGRIGIRPEQALSFFQELLTLPELEIQGVFTHLAKADSWDKTQAHHQLDQFLVAVNRLTAAGIVLSWISAANSATIIDLPRGYFNMVRPGIILYGLPPSSTMHRSLDLSPAMQFKTKIVFIKQVQAGTPIGYGGTYTTSKETFIATLPVGYADGYSRDLSNRASVLIGGRRCPVVGRVCMDQIMVDLGLSSDAQIGDEVVLFGRQGDEEITVTELADLAGTINYELVCAISGRVPRVYFNE
ncbi:MAG: alanine racemase [Thermodesulfobacteriota bacterium]|nr:alanine racemase [Thermodesulfobacteriota bacterium]